MSGHISAFRPAADAIQGGSARAGLRRRTIGTRGSISGAIHGESVRAWAGALWARFMLMRHAAETRRELGTLDPRLLADIGLSRAEASREAERWPWDLAPGRHPGRGTGSRW